MITEIRWKEPSFLTSRKARNIEALISKKALVYIMELYLFLWVLFLFALSATGVGAALFASTIVVVLILLIFIVDAVIPKEISIKGSVLMVGSRRVIRESGFSARVVDYYPGCGAIFRLALASGSVLYFCCVAGEEFIDVCNWLDVEHPEPKGSDSIDR